MVGGTIEKDQIPGWFQTVGTILALSSGFFIGLSLILQKKGLLDTAQVRQDTGNEYAYLKSKLWWLVTIGELCNFGAYAFSPAIIVTPLGAISVVVSAILSVFVLNEKLNFSGICGIMLCIIGSVIIVFHGPPTTATETIPQFISYVLHPVFLVFLFLSGGLLIWLIFFIAPLYGPTQPVVYLSITSIGGAFLVNAAQGFGSSILYSIRYWKEDNQFLHWELYVLGVFVAFTAVFQINYLNKSLQYFSTSIVTPVNYVFFSTFTIITSAILYRGFNVTSFINGATIVLGFMVIVVGVALLFQYNLKLNKLQRQLERSALETEISRAETVLELEENLDEPSTDQDPISLMVETFPFRRVRRRPTTSSVQSFLDIYAKPSISTPNVSLTNDDLFVHHIPLETTITMSPKKKSPIESSNPSSQ